MLLRNRFFPVLLTAVWIVIWPPGLTARIVDAGDVALNLARHSENFTDRDGPPIYLQTQHFLC